MFFTVDRTVLIVIDVQGKLAHLMYERDKTIQNMQALIKGAKTLGVPIVWTEQLPEKIGNTIPEIAGLLQELKPIEKVTFSCYPNKRFQETIKDINRRQILVAGIESHVCVYQTVSDLIKENYQVQVVCDAVSSRTRENKEAGLEKMKASGAGLTCVEMILCELLQTAEHAKFKEILALMK